MKAECVPIFQDKPALLRGSLCVDWFNFDLLHLLGNGIAKRTIDATVALMKASNPGRGVYKALLKKLNKLLKADILLWGSSPSSGTAIRAVYKDVSKFKNVTCKEYMYLIQKLLLVLFGDTGCEFFPAAEATAVRRVLSTLTDVLLIVSKKEWDKVTMTVLKGCVGRLGLEVHEAFSTVDTCIYYKIHIISHLVRFN